MSVTSTSRENGHSRWSLVMRVGFIIFMIFGIFLPTGCSLDDQAASGGGQFSISMLDTDGDGILNSIDTDDDGDGLIEIDSLEKLHNIRYNLIGTSYKISDGDAGDTTGCGGTNGVNVCSGYELTQDLSFDKNKDGTWSGDSTSGYTLDVDDNASPYFVVDAAGNGGWKPIGGAIIDNNGAINCNNNTCFNAIFEGNSHIITGLALRRKGRSIGMFKAIGANANIRNIGLVDNLTDCTSMDPSFVGGLVGLSFGSITTASSATGAVNGAINGADHVGGLVGQQAAGSITGGYATGAVNGGGNIGGLVGRQVSGSITGSYATGTVNGGSGNDRVGGLVGVQIAGSNIIDSYAIGSVTGGDGNDHVGGLLGDGYGSNMIGSYATGSVDGGDGNDHVGGLGHQNYGSIFASYGFSVTTNGEIINNDGSSYPTNVISATALTDGNTPDSWNTDWWGFGTDMQTPALKYFDYDGSGDKYYCDNVTPPTTGTPIPISNCGDFIPGQGR